jgi:hypothetical protein
MRDHGLTIAVLPKNLLEHMQSGAHGLFYRGLGVDVAVGGRGGAHGDLQISWTGPGDGELAVTGGTNPYLGRAVFVASDSAIREYEDRRAAAEASGVRFVTVSELVAAARERAPFPDLPPLTDGTWQPDDTRNLHRWMGGLGGLFDILVPTENDNAVLTTNARASLSVRACEIVAAWSAGRPGAADRSRLLDAAVRELNLAQVSDSTGWNPWLGEVRYSLDHAAEALELAHRCIDHEPLRGPPRRRVDLATGEVSDAPPPAWRLFPSARPPFEVRVFAPGRTAELTWRQLSADRLELVADFGPSATRERTVSLIFPLGFSRVVYAPALDEARLVDLPASAFDAPEHTLPLPSGLVGLGYGVFLVKDVRTVHLAALVRPRAAEVELRDDTARADEPQRWRFEVVLGDASRAQEVAADVNLGPTLDFDLTPPRSGCSALSHSPGSGLAPLLALAALAAALRSRLRRR